MKTTITTLLLLGLVTGCVYNYPYSHPPGGPGPGATYPTSQYTVINNTGYLLKVYQDGKYLTDLRVGEVLPVRGTLLWRNTIVTVTGVDNNGNFVGSDSWTYQFGVPEAWTVVNLNSPRRPR